MLEKLRRYEAFVERAARGFDLTYVLEIAFEIHIEINDL